MKLGPLYALGFVVAVAACAPPIAVKRLSPAEAQRELSTNAIANGKPSDFSMIELRRYDLLTLFDDDPVAAIAQLHQRVKDGTARSEELFALAELSYIHAANGGGRPYFLASALYAYALIFSEVDGNDTLSDLDPRKRWAANLYNAALAQAFMAPDYTVGDYVSGIYDLPFGRITLAVNAEHIRKPGMWELTDLSPSTNVAITGLRNRYRRVGIGTPLAGRVKIIDPAMPGAKYAAQAARVPVTMLLRLDTPRAQLRGSELSGELEFFPFSDVASVEINETPVPLESEPSVALAETLVASRFWTRELATFLGHALGQKGKSQLSVLEPYRKGRIPVVFVHGTGSSAARWADMANDLLADPRIHEDFHFWFYNYDSGNPIPYSAYKLRKSLTEMVAFLDPTGTDPCLHHVVVIGHSQGGLLTKMMAIDSGDQFWRNWSSTPFDQVKMSAEQRTLLRDALFVEPLPFVDRLIFIATPHRGSYLAGPQIVRRLLQRLITLPADVIQLSTAMAGTAVGAGGSTSETLDMQVLPTAIDNMSPKHPFIKAISGIPIAPNVHVNSIIPVKGEGPFEDGNDGVVQYRSAHIDGVESELVVRSSHSTQGNPHTIEEVRRILLEHAGAVGCSASPTLTHVEPAVPVSRLPERGETPGGHVR